MGAPCEFCALTRLPSNGTVRFRSREYTTAKKKIKVEVRLYREYDDSGRLYPAVTMEGQPHVWTPDFIASTIIEMEYEEQP